MTHAIAVDAMGGDHAPGPEVAGAVGAVREADLEVRLVGDRERLEAELSRLGARDQAGIEVVHASQVVGMSDQPSQAFRQKTDSSLRVAFDLVKKGDAEAVVSAGNSGAFLAHGLFVLKRLPEVERPGIVTVFPTPEGTLVLCDMGANVDVKPTTLAQFAVLAAQYDRIVHRHPRPRVGLLSNGTEESKGTELTRAANQILRDAANNPEAEFEYVGYVEGSGMFLGGLDVVATDGFTGNVVLKLAEGVSQAVIRMVKSQIQSSLLAKLGAPLVKPALMQLKDAIHYSEAGGALLAGVNGVAIICHGRSDAVAIKNAIKAGARFAGAHLTDELAAAMKRHRGLWQKQLEPSTESA